MRKNYKFLIFGICLAVTCLCFLPVMSRASGASGTCMLIIRGYNLMEFSGLGCIPILTPLLIPGILFGHQSRAAQEIEIMLLFLASMASYIHSFNSAREWLLKVGSSIISLYPGALLMPLGLILVFAFAISSGPFFLWNNFKG